MSLTNFSKVVCEAHKKRIVFGRAVGALGHWNFAQLT